MQPRIPMKTFHTTRHLPASASEIFQAFQSPERFARWWGPKGFINTFHHFDFQKNGHWSFTMHGPDGKNYPNQCRFLNIEHEKLIAWEHVVNPHFFVCAQFDSCGKDSKVTFSMIFDNPEICHNIKTIVVPSNEQNMDRLESILK